MAMMLNYNSKDFTVISSFVASNVPFIDLVIVPVGYRKFFIPSYIVFLFSRANHFTVNHALIC